MKAIKLQLRRVLATLFGSIYHRDKPLPASIPSREKLNSVHKRATLTYTKLKPNKHP
jgi:hypothetical protein